MSVARIGGCRRSASRAGSVVSSGVGTTSCARGRIGSMRTGRTTISSSVSLRWNDVLEKSSPSTGRSLSSGMPVRMRSCSLLNIPEMTRLWLRRTSSVLSIRRVRSAGMRKPPKVIAFE